ncbi:unnamed protein product [Lactuca virosa]|uniref:Uncharacterized protein n=1 Tax=Lactuca virosa TaxID=75947 RepID=A0AAU9NTG3_9ASTR|nr:unnamed protein product [Lactuca virosa]
MWLELEEYLERHEPVKLDPDQVLRHGFVAAEWAVPDLDIDDTGWNVDPAKQKWMEYQGDQTVSGSDGDADPIYILKSRTSVFRLSKKDFSFDSQLTLYGI